MLDLLVAADLVRQQTRGSLTPETAPKRPEKPVRHRRARVRSTSAAVLRGLAERLEPSPTG